MINDDKFIRLSLLEKMRLDNQADGPDGDMFYTNLNEYFEKNLDELLDSAAPTRTEQTTLLKPDEDARQSYQVYSTAHHLIEHSQFELENPSQLKEISDEAYISRSASSNLEHADASNISSYDFESKILRNNY